MYSSTHCTPLSFYDGLQFCEIFCTSFIHSHTAHYYSLINARCAFSKCWKTALTNARGKWKWSRRTMRRRRRERRGLVGATELFSCWKASCKADRIPTLQHTDKVLYLWREFWGVLFQQCFSLMEHFHLGKLMFLCQGWIHVFCFLEAKKKSESSEINKKAGRRHSLTKKTQGMLGAHSR